MKKFFTIASLLALTLSACSKEAAKSEQEGKGQVTISCVTSDAVDATRANISCTTPTADEFTLKIEGQDFSKEYATIAEFNADSYLHHGSYKATVVAGDLANEGDDMATFAGSAEFVVEARKQHDVEITAYIANALVQVDVTENFKNYFVGGYTLTLTTAAGNEFDVTAQTEPIFVAPASFTIGGTAVKQPNQSGAEGVTVALPEYKPTNVAAQTLYNVTFDVETAGSATLTISLNDTLVESIDIEQELNDNAQ
jgi:opacity protein-like surface antigen